MFARLEVAFRQPLGLSIWPEDLASQVFWFGQIDPRLRLSAGLVRKILADLPDQPRELSFGRLLARESLAAFSEAFLRIREPSGSLGYLNWPKILLRRISGPANFGNLAEGSLWAYGVAEFGLARFGLSAKSGQIQRLRRSLRRRPLPHAQGTHYGGYATSVRTMPKILRILGVPVWRGGCR